MLCLLRLRAVSCGVALVVVLVVVVRFERLSLLDESVDDFACVVSAECELSAAWQCDGCGGWFGGVCVAYCHGASLVWEGPVNACTPGPCEGRGLKVM